VIVTATPETELANLADYVLLLHLALNPDLALLSPQKVRWQLPQCLTHW
jgi:hypothetical protein